MCSYRQPKPLLFVCFFYEEPQTPGELRSRSGRLHSFQSLDEVTSALQSLQTKTGGPYVCQLPREPGKREQRYQECFCNESERPQADVSVSNEEYTQQLKERILELEAQVEKLNERIQELENASGL
ncbi:DUF480 domain-containing protein [Marinomonas rhodophyticola]|uniref:DUF480 domain-containing protein n=1 Tax=Marinomonas rhodophyticola TaxID=2992803 RepID=UPI002AA2B317|nr:DUF480 domain-containing protein [Marinomonas sp. KJ51-3]